MRNAGLLFYKEYFKDYEVKNNEIKFGLNPKNLFALKLDAHNKLYESEDNFELTTIYPGLLIGSGYNHEIGDQENELKLGFFFDHTTGLPCVPGSSVKGVLRNACEKNGGEYVKSIIEELAKGERKPNEQIVEEETAKLTSDQIDGYFDKVKNTNSDKYSVFVMKVFVGKKDKENYFAQKERDIFFDAFPVNSFNEEEKFLANDFITPHKHPTNHKLDPFTNPNPIQFLKVLPRVTFKFNFRLTDTCIKKEVKLELFRQILLDLGIGAKTNVGYGQFIEKDRTADHNSSGRESVASELNHNIPRGMTLTKKDKYDAQLTKLENGYAFFVFKKSDKEITVKKKIEKVIEKITKQGFEGELKIGEVFTIKIESDFIDVNSNFSFQISLR